MSTENLSMHYVCTPEEAGKLIKDHSDYWVSNCGCREKTGCCSQSNIDLCLTFYNDIQLSGTGRKKVTAEQINSILDVAKTKYLVARPFRDESFTRTDGICFCCNDCCGYFLDKTEKCDKGIFIERTNLSHCTNCGECIDICYFNARSIKNNLLEIYSENCYGCGLCINVCPLNCIEMITR